MKQESHKVLKFAQRFGVKHWQKYPHWHAELNAISKIWGKEHIDHHFKMVVLRINSFMQLQNSKPCRNCMIVLNSLGINKIWHSTNNGDIVKYKN